MTANAVATPETCNEDDDGSIDLSVSGGTTPYGYSWSNGATTEDISGLSAGTYTVTVTDFNGCTTTASATVTEPDPLTANAVATPETCNEDDDGSIDLSVSGGTTPYGYSWSNGATTEDISGLSAGTYTVTVTDFNGCTTTASATVTEPDPLTANAVATPETCNEDDDGSIDLSVSGGTTPYGYSWSNGATTEDISGLSAGTYTVTVTDFNGCTTTASATVTEPDPLTATAVATPETCNEDDDGSIDLSVSGGTTPYGYSWSNGATTEDISGLSAGTYTVTVTDFNGCTTTASATVTEPDPLTATAVATPETCNEDDDGSIDLSVSGGTTPYGYSWSNGATTEDISGLSAGTYTVTVTDFNGCTTTASATVTEPDPLTATAVATPETCNEDDDGSIDLSVSGGTTPYGYSWSNGATTEDISGLSAGTYTVTVTDFNGCTTTASATVTEPDPLTANAVATPETCNEDDDGSIDLSVSGGTTPYGYSWSNGATTEDISGLSAGTYTVTVTDFNGCTTTASATVTEPDPLTATAVATPETCNEDDDGSIDLSVSGGTTPYGYSWSNGATTEDISGLSAGTYTVTVTDFNGCTTTASATVTEPDPLTATAVATPETCNEDDDGSIDLSVSGGTTPYGYSWSNGATTEDISGLSAGTYTVTVTDFNGCTTTASATVTEPDPLTANAVATPETCNEDDDGSIDLSVSGGTTPYGYSWSNGATTEDISGLSAGTYTVTVTDFNGCTTTASATVTEPDPLTANAVATPETCNEDDDGSIDLSVSGGTTPYGYSWSNGATTEDISGLSAGTYTVTVTDFNGCTTTASATVTEPDPLTANAVATPETCNEDDDGSIDLSVSGGTTPYGYSWSNGATTEDISGLSAGTYTVTVTDFNGCTTTASATVTEPDPLTANAVATPETCNEDDDGSIDLSVSGGTTPYGYSWSNGATTEDISGLSAGTYTVTVTDFNGCTTTAGATVTEPDPLTANAVATPETCNEDDDGSIDLSVSGGTTPYGYSWSNGATTEDISGLSAGTYTVTVTDFNGCTTTASATVTEPDPLTATAVATPETCNEDDDGSIDLSVSGGTTPYGYSWSNGATTEDISGLSAGTYTVTVTDFNGCTTTASATVTEPDPLTATAVATPETCNEDDDGSIDLSVSGGTTPYGYSWSNGATTEDISGLSAGTYTVTVTDFNGCTTTASATVTEPDPLTANAVATPETCNEDDDGSIDLSVSGGTTPYGYSWSNGATTEDISGLSAGTYTVTVTDFNGCTTTASATVTEPDPLTANAVATPETCNEDDDGSIDLSVSGGTTPYGYSWSNGATTEDISGLSAGTYTVTVTDFNGCTTTASATVTEPDPLEIESDAIIVDATCNVQNDGSIDITVTGGTLPYDYSWSNGATTEDLSNVIAGAYSVTVSDANNCTTTESFLIDENCFDLALRKTVISSGPYSQGSTVTFQIEVINQGSIDATNVEITDYIPMGLNLIDGAWAQSGSMATRTIVGPITANGGIATVTINFAIDGSFQGSSLVNYAEISDAENSLGLADEDSTPDQDNTNDAGGQPESAADDYVDGDGTGTPGDGVAATDEDDHDPALINLEQTFDLALRKTVISSGPYSQGSTVTFQIEVINQGSIDATNVEITDYIPMGLNLTDGAWAQSGSMATRTIVGPITANGGIATVTINFAIDGSFQGSSLVNYAEISDAENSLGLADEDSTPDQDNTNDAGGQPESAADDYVDGDGTGTPGDGVAATDEDDHDPALINLEQTFDLALRKTVISSGPYSQGSTVTFQIEVINQGSIDATNVEITDYIPMGLNLADGAWAQSGSMATRTIVGPITANGGIATVTINFAIDGSFQGSSLVNYAEISDAENSLDLADEDSTPDQDNTNDAGGQPESAADDYVDGDGTGTPGDGVAATDEDDHDPALINVKQTFDLALRKKLKLGESGVYYQNQDVTFIITVFNQGTLDAYNIKVIDYIPTGFILADPAWNPNGTNATREILGPLMPGDSTKIEITLNTGNNPTPGLVYNYSEIATAEDANGPADDEDSTPNEVRDDDTVKDDVIDEDGKNNPGEDEDDHDLEPLTIISCDIVLVGSVDDVKCYGESNGSIDITITGGTAPYTYAWSNGATSEDIFNLSAGTYTVTVTDANACKETLSKTVSQPDQLLVSVTGINSTCTGSNGSATATVTGGTAPIGYAWSNGGTDATISGLSAGTYTVTVTDANGCTDTGSVTIIDEAGPEVSVTGTNETCSGSNGSATATVSGGTAPIGYAWSNGGTDATISGLSAGTYTVTVTDANGCTDTGSVTIIDEAGPEVSVTGTNETCSGSNGSATATVSGGTAPIGYAWSNGGTDATISGLSAGTYTVTVTDANGCTDAGSVTIIDEAGPEVSVTGTNETCTGSNGSATATVSGGTAPIGYAWSNGGTDATISGLSAGTYSVTVTDANGCTDAGSVTIIDEAGPEVSVTGANETCSGSNGSATATVSGGTSPIGYAWSNGGTDATISGLSAGTYTVTVTDANGCKDVGSVTIIDEAGPEVSVTGANETCSGSNGSATATVSGGTAPIGYAWSNGSTDATISGLSAGTYTVTVTDANGCTDVGSVTIIDEAGPEVSVTGTNETCTGSNGSATATVSGGTAPIGYAWSNGGTDATISGLSAGTYTITVTDANGCKDVGSVTIIDEAGPEVRVTGANETCTGSNGSATATVSGGTAPIGYAWSNGGTDATISGLSAGTYTVTVTDANGCTDVGSVTIIDEAGPEVSVTGANETCTGSNGSATATVSGGTAPIGYAWSNGGTDATISGLSAGTYTVTVTDANGCTDVGSVTIIDEAGPEVSVTGANETCTGSNGSATATVSGGTAPIGYAWSNGGTDATISGLSAGTYTVTVTDANGCTDVGSVTIIDEAGPEVSVTGANETCTGSNGSATATVSGGTSPIGYAWSNGGTDATISGLNAGTYTVTVTDANGCTDVGSVTIIDEAGPEISVTGANETCTGSNGSATATVSGGTAPIGYAWSNGGTDATISGLNAGTYTVTVTDANGCTDVGSVTIIDEAGPEVSVTGANETCTGSNGSATATVSGGTSPIGYAWSNGGTDATISGLRAGTYTVTVTDANGCTDVGSVTIIDEAGPEVNVTGENETCTGSNGSATATVSGGTSPIGYAWSNGGTDATISGLRAGTYMVTVTDANGCTDVGSVTIIDEAGPEVSVTGANETCTGSNGSATATVSGGTAPIGYAWSNGGTDATISGLSAGTYMVTVTDANGCTDAGSVTIIDEAGPEVNVTGENETCTGSNGSATATVSGGTSPIGYAWSNGGTDATISGLRAGTYTVTVTDANGCTDVGSVTIIDEAGPEVSVTGANETCTGSNGSATATVSGGTLPIGYAWSNGGTDATISGLRAGTYTVTVTDANGCTDVGSITIIDEAGPEVNVTGANETCTGSNGSATATVSGGTAPIGYAWSNGGTDATISGLSAGTYTVTVTDANGCTDVGSITIIDEAGPEVNVTGANETCTGSNGSATATVSGGTAPIGYAWSNGGTDATISGLGAGTYTVTVTDANGCTDAGSVTIIDKAGPEISVTGANETCTGSNGSATATVSGGTAPIGYAWSNGGTDATISGLSAGTYTVTVTDANGCKDAGSVTIIDEAGPEVSVTGTNETCTGSNGSATATVSGGTAPIGYAWSNGGTDATISGLSAGTYTVTVTDANGCKDVGSVTIIDEAGPEVSVTGTNETCTGSNGSATATVSGGTAPIGYAWSNGGTDATISGLSAGTYTVTVTDANGCTDAGSITIVDEAGPEVALKINQITCANSSDGQIEAVVTGGTSPIDYSWSNGSTDAAISGLSAGTYTVTVTDASGCTDFGSVTLVGESSPEVSLQVEHITCLGSNDGHIEVVATGGLAPYNYYWNNGQTTSQISGLSAGVYSVTVTDANGCTSSEQVTVEEGNFIQVNIQGSNSICDANSGSATSQVSGGTAPYSYQWSNGATTGNIDNLTAGVYTLTVTDASGCTGTGSVTIEVENTDLEAKVNGGAITCTNESVILEVTANVPIAGYKWSGPNGFNSDLATPEVMVSGEYCVTITDTNGCTGTACGIVENKVEIPDLEASGGEINCIENLVQLFARSSIDGVTYLWLGPNAFTSNEQNPIVDMPGTYTVMVSAPNGCIAQTSVVVLLNKENPEIDIDPESLELGCGETSGQIALITNAIDASFLWIGPGGFVSTDQNPVVNTAGIYIVTVTGSNGCSSSDTAEVVISGNLNIRIRPDTITCAKPAIYLDVTSNSHIVRFAWTGPDGFVSDNPRPFIADPGLYTLIAQGENGCVDTTSVEILEDSQEPDIQAEGGMITCEFLKLQLYGFSNTIGVTYFWTGPEDFESTEPNPFVTIPGDYMLEVTGRNGCTVITIVKVTKEPCGNIGDFVWIDGNCNGMQDTIESGLDSILIKLFTCDSVLVARTYTDSLGKYHFDNLIPNKEYFITVDSLPEGIELTLPNAMANDSLDSDVDPITFRTECFSIENAEQDTSIDIGFCKKEECDLVVVASGPNLTCDVECVMLTAEANGEDVQFVWSGPYGFRSELQNPKVGEPGIYVVIVTDSLGCEATDSLQIFREDKPDITVIGGELPCDSTGVQIFAHSNTPNVSYAWIGPDGFRSNDQNPIVYLPGIYTVIVTDTIGGCYDKKIVEVTLGCCNVIDGGVIVGDEEACGPYDPGIIENLVSPFGGKGNLEYIWMKTTDPHLPIMQWTPIFIANGPEWDPEPISQTTYYARCSRREGCVDFIGETNVVVKRVIGLPTLDTSSIVITNETVCDGHDGTISFTLDNNNYDPYLVGIRRGDKDLFFGPYLDSVIVLTGLEPGEYSHLIIRNSKGCISEYSDFEILIEAAECTSPVFETKPAVISVYPNPVIRNVNVSYYIGLGVDQVRVELVDLAGKVIKFYDKSAYNLKNVRVTDQIDVSEVRSGMYFIRVIKGNEIEHIPLEIMK